jgi:hypothetical protein
VKVLLQPARPLHISGRILDKRTKTPIAGATVRLTDYIKLSCISDATGYFRLIADEDFYKAYEASVHSSPPGTFTDWLNVSHQRYMAQMCHGSAETEILLEPKP